MQTSKTKNPGSYFIFLSFHFSFCCCVVLFCVSCPAQRILLFGGNMTGSSRGRGYVHLRTGNRKNRRLSIQSTRHRRAFWRTHHVKCLFSAATCPWTCYGFELAHHMFFSSLFSTRNLFPRNLLGVEKHGYFNFQCQNGPVYWKPGKPLDFVGRLRGVYSWRNKEFCGEWSGIDCNEWAMDRVL